MTARDGRTGSLRGRRGGAEIAQMLLDRVEDIGRHGVAPKARIELLTELFPLDGGGGRERMDCEAVLLHHAD